MTLAFSYHGIFSLLSISLILAIGINNVRKYLETKERGLLLHSITYFSGGLAFLLALIPTFLKNTELFSLFFLLCIAIISFGIGIFFYLLYWFYFHSQPLSLGIFFSSLFLGGIIVMITILFPPHIKILDGWTQYIFPTILKIPMIALFVMSMLGGGIFFLRQTLKEIKEKAIKRKGILISLGYYLVASGVLLVILGEPIIFNFLFLLGYIIIFICTLFR